MNSADRTAEPGFQKRLGLFDGTMLVAGSMIGSGVYIVSAETARDTGGSGWLMAAWGVAGLMTILGALAYAELAAMMPFAGGQYVYLREAYSPLWGFLYGWTSFMVIQTGTIAAVGVAFAKFLGVLVPVLGTGDQAIIYHGGSFAGIPLQLPWLAEPIPLFAFKEFTISRGQLIGVATVFLLTWWNTLGIQQGKVLQNVFTVTKIGSLFFVIVVAWLITYKSGVWSVNWIDPWGGIKATARFQEINQRAAGNHEMLIALMVFAGALVGALFSCDAWNNVTFTAGEVRNPQRNLPMSLILGTGSVITLYLLTNAGYLGSLPLKANLAKREAIQQVAADRDNATPEQLEIDRSATPLERGIEYARDDRVATAVIQEWQPGWGVTVMAIAIMISTFGCNNGLILMGARLTWAMARDGVFFRSVGHLNRNGVPAIGLWVQALWAGVLTFSGTYGDLLDYVIFAALLFYALTVGGLFLLRFRRPDAPRPYRALGYPNLPALYLIMCVAVMLDLLIVKPKLTWPGLLLVVLGVPVYFLWRLIRR
jgi:APA family basic amino acid/polyamine antiporter